MYSVDSCVASYRKGKKDHKNCPTHYFWLFLYLYCVLCCVCFFCSIACDLCVRQHSSLPRTRCASISAKGDQERETAGI